VNTLHTYQAAGIQPVGPVVVALTDPALVELAVLAVQVLVTLEPVLQEPAQQQRPSV